MVVQIGKDKIIRIEDDIFSSICNTLKRFQFETGGIIGANEHGVISVFQFDDIKKPRYYEYYPNINFLNKIINEEWQSNKITFAGFVHSHLHNSEISKQDIEYARQIIESNIFLKYILIGIVDLSVEKNKIQWTVVNKEL